MINRHAPLLLAFSFILCSCAAMNPAAEKRAYCNTLKSKMVFNGSTGVTREANIQEAELPLTQHNYDQADCDNS